MKKINLLVLILFILVTIKSTTLATNPTSPSLGTAEPFSILTKTYTNGSNSTIINGDIGYLSPPTVAPTSTKGVYVNDSTFNGANIDQNTALADLNSQPCTFTFANGAIELPTDATHGTVGIYTPGVYCILAAANITTQITLSGSGTYIFRINDALATAASTNILLSNGATANNVWWTTGGALGLGANSTFIGNAFSNAITVGANTSWIGRAFSFDGTITTGLGAMVTAPVYIPSEIEGVLDLGSAETFGILAATYTNGLPGTTINGNIGYNTPPSLYPTSINTGPVSPSIYTSAGYDQGLARAVLSSRSCTYTFPAGAVILSTHIIDGLTGVYPPGVYCISGAASIGASGITLTGGGTYIFRINGAITTAVGSKVRLTNYAAAGDIWWTTSGAVTLGANSIFIGSAFSNTITMHNDTLWTGRALAFGGTITTHQNSVISVPTIITYRANIIDVNGLTLDYNWDFTEFPGSVPPIFSTGQTGSTNTKASISTGFTVIKNGEYTIKLTLEHEEEIIYESTSDFNVSNQDI